MQVFSRKSDEKLFGMTANSPAIHHPSTTGGAETENRKQKRKKPAATYPRQAEQKQKSENRKEKSRRRRKRLPSTCIANDAWPVAFSFSVVFLFLFYFSFLFFFSFFPLEAVSSACAGMSSCSVSSGILSASSSCGFISDLAKSPMESVSSKGFPS